MSILRKLTHPFANQKQPKRIRAELDNAWTTFKLDPQSGVEMMSELVRKYPDMAEPHVILSSAYLQMGELGTALSELNEAFSVDPRNPEALIARSTLYLNAISNASDGAISAKYEELAATGLAVTPVLLAQTDTAPDYMKGVTLEALDCDLDQALDWVEEHSKSVAQSDAHEVFRQMALAHAVDVGMIRQYRKEFFKNEKLAEFRVSLRDRSWIVRALREASSELGSLFEEKWEANRAREVYEDGKLVQARIVTMPFAHAHELARAVGTMSRDGLNDEQQDELLKLSMSLNFQMIDSARDYGS